MFEEKNSSVDFLISFIHCNTYLQGTTHNKDTEYF